MRQLWKCVLLGVLCCWISGCNWSGPAPKPVLPRSAPGVSVQGAPVGDLEREQIISVLTGLADQTRAAPQNAGFDERTGEIYPEAAGRELDIQATADKVLNAAAGAQADPVYTNRLPDITAEKLKSARQIGAYTTRIQDAAAGRTENIRLTAQLINNAALPPGSEFSFNRQTGEPTAERGFQPATIFAENGQHDTGIGGGMCQVSSTLYNAVLAARLPVRERHPHSQPVTYVPPGRDATTFTDKDFRFQNSTAGTIVLRAFIHGRDLTVDLWQLER